MVIKKNLTLNLTELPPRTYSSRLYKMAMALTPRKEDIYESLTLPNYHVLKEGILYSYNRRVKNWLKRYWYLIDDGTMLGYKERRRNDLKSPLVHFPIKVNIIY